MKIFQLFALCVKVSFWENTNFLPTQNTAENSAAAAATFPALGDLFIMRIVLFLHK